VSAETLAPQLDALSCEAARVLAALDAGGAA